MVPLAGKGPSVPAALYEPPMATTIPMISAATAFQFQPRTQLYTPDGRYRSARRVREAPPRVYARRFFDPPSEVCQ